MDLSAVISQAKKGDKQAFATLYSHYNKDVYRTAFAALQDKDASLEVVKTVFKQIQPALKRIKNESAFSARLDELTQNAIQERKSADAQKEIQPAQPVQSEPEQKEEPAAAAHNAAPVAPRQITEPHKRKSGSKASAQKKHQPAAAANADTMSAFHQYLDQEAAAVSGYEDGIPVASDLPIKNIAPKKGHPVLTILLIFSILLVLVLLWALTGLLMKNQIIPYVDLGYSWFNFTVFNFF